MNLKSQYDFARHWKRPVYSLNNLLPGAEIIYTHK